MGPIIVGWVSLGAVYKVRTVYFRVVLPLPPSPYGYRTELDDPSPPTRTTVRTVLEPCTLRSLTDKTPRHIHDTLQYVLKCTNQLTINIQVFIHMIANKLMANKTQTTDWVPFCWVL